MVAAAFYAVAALCLKRAINLGFGPWRTAFASNVSFGLGFIPLLLLAEKPVWEMNHPAMAILCGFLFFCGALCALLSITKGDVSLSTPVMGVKAVLVAVLLAVFFDEAFNWTIWAGSITSVVGLFVMQLQFKGENLQHVGRTILLAGGSALAYASCDALFQIYGGHEEMFVFLPTASFMSGVFAFLLLPFMKNPVTDLPRPARKWLILGCVTLVLQGHGIAVAIGLFQDAAGANIVYSTRGMWSVLLVVLVGHWFHSTEGHISRSLMIRRLLGSALLTLAVVFVFL